MSNVQDEAAFEAAVEAVIHGDEAELARQLRAHPDLVRTRSTQDHNATLLIYTSANGVEGDRQKSPKNAPAIAEMLLAAGADVDATADVYHGHCTTLGLVATSEPPRASGVQIPLIDVMLAHGARMDLENAGNGHSLLHACFANGQPDAAEHLAGRGAPIDLFGAAGLGRVDVLRQRIDAAPQPSPAQLADAFAIACGYGRAKAVEFLLDRGFAVDARLDLHGTGHTGLHVAAYHGHADVVDLLLARGANIEALAETWPTPPLKWALAAWKMGDTESKRAYVVVARLVQAGAAVTPDTLEWESVRADPQMRSILEGRPIA